MRVLIYGGSFDPPHLGHTAALQSAIKAVEPDKTLVIPAGIPPHKAISGNSPGAETRLELCRLAFGSLPGVEVSDIELRRKGKSYTVDTLRELREALPGAELIFLMGTDMLLYMEHWWEFREIFALCTIAALPREDGEMPALEKECRRFRETYGARILLLDAVPVPMSSTQVRAALPERRGAEWLAPAVYERIIRSRLYGAQPELGWLRTQTDAWIKPGRIPHIRGVEQESIRLAQKYGVDEGLAAEAGILHDITKRCKADEQLRLCQKYGIMLDAYERAEPKVLHARTGCHFAREHFGVTDAVFDAIEWHTTGRPGMSKLEMIVYLADITEPNRDFEGVDKLRRAVDQSLYLGMEAALTGSMDSVRRKGGIVHPRSQEALDWVRKELEKPSAQSDE